MFELELSCPVTPQELLVSRVLIACVYNFALNLCLSLTLFAGSPPESLWRIALLWLASMSVTGGAALWLCARVRSVFAVPVTLACWVSAAILLAPRPGLIETLLHGGLLCAAAAI